MWLSPQLLVFCSVGSVIEVWMKIMQIGCLAFKTYCSHAVTEFTEAVNENTDGISKHRLSSYNAHYLNYNFLFSFWFQYLMIMRFKVIQSRAIDTTLW